MSLKDSRNNQIIKIESIKQSDNRVRYNVFLDVAHKDSGDSKFQKSVAEDMHVGKLSDELNELADPKKSINDNILSAGYRALKTENVFKDMIDI